MSTIPAAIVAVPLAERAYSIRVGAGLLGDAPYLPEQCVKRPLH
jgi:hypothetical protein